MKRLKAWWIRLRIRNSEARLQVYHSLMVVSECPGGVALENYLEARAEFIQLTNKLREVQSHVTIN